MSLESFINTLQSNHNWTDVFLKANKNPELCHWNGEIKKENRLFSAEELHTWILKELGLAKKNYDAAYPFAEWISGSIRFHAVFSPIIAHGPHISLRKIKNFDLSPFELYPNEKNKIYSIQKFFQQKNSILISGATGSGKTTLLRWLIESCPENERVLILEDSDELNPIHARAVTLKTRKANPDGHGEISLKDLIRESLRMKPDRIILGEVRGNEILDWLQALQTGHLGSACTLHACSAEEALERIEFLIETSTQTQMNSKRFMQFLGRSLGYLLHLNPKNPKNSIEILPFPNHLKHHRMDV